MFCRFVKSSNQRFIFTTLPINKYIHTRDTAVVKLFFFKRAKSEKLIFECNLASSSLLGAARNFPDPLPFEMKRFILKKGLKSEMKRLYHDQHLQFKRSSRIAQRTIVNWCVLKWKTVIHTVTLFFFHLILRAINRGLVLFIGGWNSKYLLDFVSYSCFNREF